MKIDAQQFDRIARSVFAPVYPLIAEQIIARTGVRQGLCLDIGCGGGYLGAALGRISDLFVRFFDQSAEMLAIAERTIVENGLEQRAATLQGIVTDIGLKDDVVDLAVSRGSVFFWTDLPRALAEIYRVLARGGWAYIGGGFGSRQLREDIERQMAARRAAGEPFSQKVRRNLGSETNVRFLAALEEAGITSFSIVDDEDVGLWMVIRK